MLYFQQRPARKKLYHQISQLLVTQAMTATPIQALCLCLRKLNDKRIITAYMP